MCSINLVEPPQQIFGGAVHIIAARVIRKVIAQGGPRELLAEQIDLI